MRISFRATDCVLPLARGLTTPRGWIGTSSGTDSNAKVIREKSSHELPSRHRHLFGILEGKSSSRQPGPASHGRRVHQHYCTGELLTWVLRANSPPSRKQGLDKFLRDVTILDVTSDVATKFGEVRAELFDRGLPMPPMDLMIAATALVSNFTLVTHNTGHYRNVPNLRMVDWLIP